MFSGQKQAATSVPFIEVPHALEPDVESFAAVQSVVDTPKQAVTAADVVLPHHDIPTDVAALAGSSVPNLPSTGDLTFLDMEHLSCKLSLLDKSCLMNAEPLAGSIPVGQPIGDNSITNPFTISKIFVDLPSVFPREGSFIRTYANETVLNYGDQQISFVEGNGYEVCTRRMRRIETYYAIPAGDTSFTAIHIAAARVPDTQIQHATVELVHPRRKGKIPDTAVIALRTNNYVDCEKVDAAVKYAFLPTDATFSTYLASKLDLNLTVLDNMFIYAKLFWYALIDDFVQDLGEAIITPLTYPDSYPGTDIHWSNWTASPLVTDTIDASSHAQAIFLDECSYLPYYKDVFYLLSSTGAVWCSAATGHMLHATHLHWPGIRIHIFGRAENIGAAPVPARIPSSQLYSCALHLAARRGEWADYTRGLYWAIEQFSMRHIPGAPANGTAVPPTVQQYYYAGPLLNINPPTLPRPGDTNITARLLNIVPKDKDSSNEVSLFTNSSLAVRTRLTALYAGSLKAFCHLWLLDNSVLKTDMVRYLSVGVDTTHYLGKILNQAFTQMAAESHETLFLVAVRSGFSHYMGCTVPYDITPWHIAFRESALTADKLEAFMEVSPDYRVYGHDDYRAMDGWFTHRPVEWGIPDDRVKVNLKNEILLDGEEAMCGWYAVYGEALYSKHAQRDPSVKWWTYIPYGFSVMNVLCQYMDLPTAPGFQVQHIKCSEWKVCPSDPMTHDNLEYDPLARIYKPGTYVTYSWTQDAVSVPALVGSSFPGDYHMVVKEWNGDTLPGVGIPNRVSKDSLSCDLFGSLWA